jgi:hypothetical protein
MILCSYDVSPGYAAQAVCFQALKTSACYLAKPPRILGQVTECLVRSQAIYLQHEQGVTLSDVPFAQEECNKWNGW